MEKIAANLYSSYLDGIDLSYAFKVYKNTNFWIDLLELLTKNKFPLENIIKNCVKNDIINENIFFIYLLNDFIDYFYSSNIIPNKDLFKQSESSSFRFIISNIIHNRDDKIENYIIIMNHIKSIDTFYENYLNELYNNFIDYCVDYVKNNIINENLNYIIKVFDFISKIRDDKKNYEFYAFIKPLIFKGEIGNIEPKIEIFSYIDSEKIKNDITSIIKDDKKFGNTEYEYLNFIKICMPEKELDNTDFKNLYFNLLNKDNLKLYIQNNKNINIKNYDLNKIIVNTNINTNIQNNNNIINDSININNDNIHYINQNDIINSEIQNNNELNEDNNNIINTNNDIINNNINLPNNNRNYITNNNKFNLENKNADHNTDDEIISNEEKNDLFNNEETINLLKDNLIPFSIKEYFNQQYNKYKNKLSKDSIIKKYINSKNFKIKNLISNNIDENDFPIIHITYSKLLENINDSEKNYNKKFGYIVIDGKELLYTYHNDEIIETFLFESNKIQAYQYNDLIKHDGLKKLKEKNKDYKSVKTSSINDKISIHNQSYKSNDSSKSSPQVEYNKQKKYELTFFKGFEFESNSTIIFKYLFDLKDLPNYFFVLNKKSQKNKGNFINFIDYNKNLFSSFIETDGAYINDKNEKLLTNLKYNYHPFLIQNTFVVYKKNAKYELDSINEDLEIEPKTIIINESKLSIPKNIEEFSFDEKYEKNQIANTLIFTLNKLIQKKKYYKELVENEILTKKEEIKDYHFLFCLIYNNIPVENIEEIVKSDLKKLIKKGLIEDEFKLKIIYLIPNLGTYNLNVYQKDMRTRIDEMQNQHKIEMNNMQNQHKIEINNMQNQYKIEINNMQNQHKIEIDELKRQNNQLLLNYNLLHFEFQEFKNKMEKNK